MRTMTFALAATLAVTVAVRAQQGINQKQGFNANNVYALHDIDTVNAFNGNLTVAIPIGPEFPLAEGFSYRLTLHANANFWENEVRFDTYAQAQPNASRVRSMAVGACNSEDGYTVAFPHRRANAGIGWMLTLGRLYPSQSRVVRGWTYQSADGADHVFHETLRSTDPVNAAYRYTRDGSYLRLNVDEAAGVATIDFPDGAYHTFEQGTNAEDPWLPTKIAHRRSSEWLAIDYGTANKWILTDSHGRQHEIVFTPLNWESGQRPLVTSVSLTAFNAQAGATYTLAYEEHAQMPRPAWHEPCPAWPSTTRVQKLKSVTFPGEAGEGTTKYEFTYDTSPVQSPGVLSKAVLPTGGWIQWYWDTWQKPLGSASGGEFLAESTGVVKRELWQPDKTTPVGIWTYTSSLDGNHTTTAAKEVRTAIKDPTERTTLHLFSVAVTDGTVDNVEFRSEEYGLPFSRKHVFSDRYLSQVIYPPGITPNLDNPLANALRATFLRYDSDGVRGFGASEKNWRVKETSEVTYIGVDNAEEAVHTVHNDFDGLGHYRQTTVSGSFGTTTRTTTTNYLPSGSSALPSTWILGLYDSVTVAENDGDTATTQYNFEADGFLKRTRRIRGSAPATTDLVAVFDDSDNDGNVDAERLYGGSEAGKGLPAGYAISGQSDPSPVTHTLSHTSAYGVRATTQSAGVTFKSLDLEVDLTGLPRTSTDVSGSFDTTFDYNLRGQVKSIKPDGEAWTEYKYSTNPAVFPPASVIVRQWPSTIVTPTNTDTPLTETRYYYDYFGRLIQERTRLSTASTSEWAAVAHAYDDLGRKVATSMPVGKPGGDWTAMDANQLAATKTDYDDLGRVRKITQPDATYTEITHRGVSTIDRSVSIRTELGDERVVTRETYDPLGRLTRVTEDYGGDNVETVYTYDEGDRLTSVTQGSQAARTFTYDGAGLLIEESHPESGTTKYKYDARGNVIEKETPTAVLTTTYDSAGRVLSVAQTGVGELQSFTYGDTGTAKGRLATATRHNRHLDLGGDITVTETFDYYTTGRLRKKTTAISGGPTFEDEYTYDQSGARETIRYPNCTGCGFTPPERTITNVYKNGFLTGVTGYTNKIVYHPNGLLATLRHRNADGGDGPLLTQTIDATNRMPRPSSTAITGTCEFAITVPLPASKTVAPDEPANLSVTAPGATSYQWYVLGSTTAIPGRTSSTLTVPVSQTTSYWVRVGNGTCTVDSNVATVFVQSCAAPDTTITAPASVGPSVEASATVGGAGTYSWSIEPGTGTIVSGQNAQTVTFRSECAGSVSLSVTVTAACGTSATATKVVPVAIPSVDASASPSSIAQGQSTTLSVAVPGGPWSVTWSDGFVQNGVTGSASRPAVSPSQTTTYSVTQLNGCPGSYDSVTVFVAPPPPSTTTAARVSGGIQVVWSMPAGANADHFIVERCSFGCGNAGATWSPIVSTAAMSHLDSTAAAGSAYAYRVHAVKGGTPSVEGPLDFATNVAFTDDPVVAEVTVIKVDHLAELRTAVNALRTAAGLATVSFTDGITADLPVRAVHFTELRSALNAARSQLGFGPVSFDPFLGTGEMIRAAHVNQLRGGVR